MERRLQQAHGVETLGHERAAHKEAPEARSPQNHLLALPQQETESRKVIAVEAISIAESNWRSERARAALG